MFTGSIIVLIFKLSLSFGSVYDLPQFKDIPVVPFAPENCSDKLINSGRYKLGKGWSGIVVRVIDPDGQSRVEKRYRSLHLYNQDIIAFDFLEKSLRASESPNPELRIVRLLPTSSEMVMRFEDIKGETASSYRNRLKTPELKVAFNLWLKKNLKRLESDIMNYMVSNPERYRAKDTELNIEELTYIKTVSNDDSFNVWIHAENILLDINGNLVVIDPF